MPEHVAQAAQAAQTVDYTQVGIGAFLTSLIGAVVGAIGIGKMKENDLNSKIDTRIGNSDSFDTRLNKTLPQNSEIIGMKRDIEGFYQALDRMQAEQANLQKDFLNEFIKFVQTSTNNARDQEEKYRREQQEREEKHREQQRADLEAHNRKQSELEGLIREQKHQMDLYKKDFTNLQSQLNQMNETFKLLVQRLGQ